MAAGLGGLCDADLFAYKVAVLLHDVPWKPWVVLGRPGRVLASDAHGVAGYFNLKAGGLKANDVEALAFLKEVIEAVKEAGHGEAAERLKKAAKKLRPRVERADSRASSADRLVIGSLLRKGACEELSFRVDKLVYVNPFRPGVWMETCGRLDAEWVRGVVEEYVGRVRGLVKAVLSGAREASECDVLRLLYNLLYAFLEPLWYEATGGRCPAPPADTRMPTHTVFDHLYASALASNMEYCRGDHEEREDWLVVLVDLPGVQEFVGAGRKTRDYWAGSWLVSLTAWRAVEALVDALGPDVLVTPAATGNPFYYTYLVDLTRRVAGEDAAREVSERLSGLVLAWQDGWPSQPLMPATASLVVPACALRPNAAEAVKRAVEDAVRESWRGIAGSLLRRARQLLEGAGGEFEYELYDEYLEGVLKELEDGWPPLAVKVVVVEGARVAGQARQLAQSALKRIREALKERGLAGELDKRCGAGVAGVLVSEDALARLLSFHLAFTSVGVEAAATPTPRGAYAAWASGAVHEYSRKAYEGGAGRVRMCSVCGRLPAVVYVKPLRERGAPTPLADEREALCPVCLVKRLTGHYPGEVLDAIGYKDIGGGRQGVLSTRDLACYWDDVRRAAGQRGGAGGDGGRRHECDWIEKFAGASGIDWARELAGACREARHWLPDQVRRRVCGLTEYAALRGDGDSIGSGYLRGVLGVEPGRYVEEVYRALEESRAVPPEEEWKLRLLRDAHKTVLEAVAEALGGRVTVPVTPAYLYTLSRSLMATAILDARVVQALGGVLVFAGGDDVYALLPLAAPAVRVGDDPGKRLNPALAAVLGSYVDLYNGDAQYYREVVKVLDARQWNPGSGDRPPRLPLNGPASVPVLAVVFTRLNYWGVLDSWANGRLNPGFHVHRGMVVAAVAAYGRSYGVNVAHFRDYLWRVYRAALELEEEKDHVEYSLLGGGWAKKDVTIIALKAHDGGEESVIPNTLPGNGVEDRVAPRGRDTPLLLLARLHGLTGFAFSKSIVYDALSPTPREPLLHAYAQAGGSSGELARLLARLLERNLRIRGKGGRAAAEAVAEAAWAVLASKVRLRGAQEPLVTHVFRALRALHES